MQFKNRVIIKMLYAVFTFCFVNMSNAHAQAEVQYVTGDVYYTKEIVYKADSIKFKPLSSASNELVAVPFSKIATITTPDGMVMRFNPLLVKPVEALPLNSMANNSIARDSLAAQLSVAIENMGEKIANESGMALTSISAQLESVYMQQEAFNNAQLSMYQTEINLLTRQTLLIDSLLKAQAETPAELSESTGDSKQWVMPKASFMMYILSQPKFETMADNPTVVEYAITPRLGHLLAANFNNAKGNTRFQFALGYLIDQQTASNGTKQAQSEIVLGIAIVGQKQFGMTNIYNGARLDYYGTFYGSSEQSFISPAFVTGGEFAFAQHFSVGAEINQFFHFALNSAPDESNVIYAIQPRLSISWYL